MSHYSSAMRLCSCRCCISGVDEGELESATAWARLHGRVLQRWLTHQQSEAELAKLTERVNAAEAEARATKRSVLMAKKRLRATFDSCLDDVLAEPDSPDVQLDPSARTTVA